MNAVALEALLDVARQRWGEERAQALRPELEQLAADLNRILTHHVDETEEPGFFFLRAE